MNQNKGHDFSSVQGTLKKKKKYNKLTKVQIKQTNNNNDNKTKITNHYTKQINEFKKNNNKKTNTGLVCPFLKCKS